MQPYSPFSLGGSTGLQGISIGSGGISVSGTLGGVPITGTIPLGGSGGEAPSGGSGLVASQPTGDCPGLFQVRGPDGTCIDLTALPPGGDPAITGRTPSVPYADGYGNAVKGMYGVGIVPRVEVQTVRRCPKGTALGDDGICYKGLGRNSSRRMWPMGDRPLLTGGEMAAIRKAATAANRLSRTQKRLKKTQKALAKAC